MSDGVGTKGRDWLMDRVVFRQWCRVPVRYNDLDPLGHVNNTATAIFFEEARCQLITPKLKAHGAHVDMVLAATSIDYRRELHYPGEVEIGTVLTRLGSKSFSLAHGIFQDGICAGTGEVVLVVFDLERRTALAPPDDVRAFLETLKAA
jgi:acyl-CoA thioester hydrolase